MGTNYERILLRITMGSKEEQDAQYIPEEIFLKINNILRGIDKLPNLLNICRFLNGKNNELGSYIYTKCSELKNESLMFKPTNRKCRLLEKYNGSEKKKIRILLYPGQRNDIANLNMNETTHNMIMQYDKAAIGFCPTENHARRPSFYQRYNSVEIALLYLEALLIDACMCHYYSISDVAAHHDNKQNISREKVIFLKEYVKHGQNMRISARSRELVEEVTNILKEDTPYVSFFSIFSVASYDDTQGDCYAFLHDYFSLWSEFQKWYFNKHGRLFSKYSIIEDPVNVVFSRNKYRGQISPKAFKKEINSIILEPGQKKNLLFDVESRYAVIIIKRVPDEKSHIDHFRALFPGKLHQAKWRIVYWQEIKKYQTIWPFLEILPIMIL